MRFPTTGVLLVALLLPAGIEAQGLQRVQQRDRQDRRAWLGIALEGDPGTEPQVVEVVPDSPAAKAGLAVGDLILKINGNAAGDIDAFIRRIQGKRPGDRVRLVVRRDRRERELSVRLGENPESRAARRQGERPAERAAKPDEKPPVQKKKPEQKQPGFLGVYLDEDLTVTGVIEGSAAQRAGLATGDVILRCQGREVSDLEALVKKIQATGAGNRMELVVRRGDDLRTFRPRLLSRQQTERSGAAPARPERRPQAGELKKLESDIKKLESEIDKMERGLRKARGGEEAPKTKPKKKPKKEAKKKPKKEAKSQPKKQAETGPDRRVTKKAAGGTKWLADLGRAKRVARSSGRPILVDFYADWCKPCKMLDQSFADAGVQKVLGKYVPVRIDVDKETRLADSHGVSTIPHVVMLSPRGEKVAEFTGYLPAKMLSERLQDWARKAAGTDRRPSTARATREPAPRRTPAARSDRARRADAAEKARSDAAAKARRAPAARDAAMRGANAELRRSLQELIEAQREMNRRLEKLTELIERIQRRRR